MTVGCLECQIWRCSWTHKRRTEGINLRGIYKLNHAHRDPKRNNSNHWAILGGLLFGYFVSMQLISLADLLHLMHMRAGSVHYKPDCSRYRDIQGGTSKKKLQGTGLGLLGTHPKETRGAGKYLNKHSAPVYIPAAFLAIKFSRHCRRSHQNIKFRI